MCARATVIEHAATNIIGPADWTKRRKNIGPADILGVNSLLAPRTGQKSKKNIGPADVSDIRLKSKVCGFHAFLVGGKMYVELYHYCICVFVRTD